MSDIILLFVIFLNFLHVQCIFDPSKIDYCNAKCIFSDNATSTACNCKQAKDRSDILSHPIEVFRQAMLDEHNMLRNKIASGEEEKENGYASAADMNALNYDIELEYLARCYVLNTFVKGHDKCRMTSYCMKGKWGAGQNLFGMNRKNEGMKIVITGIHTWYNELTFIPKEKRESIVDKFQSVHEWKAGHFTEMIWGTLVKIGCARVWIPNNPNRVYQFTLVCNYAGPDKFCVSNLLGKKIYTRGTPCSKCGEGVKCNNELGGNYTALCGEIKPVPTEPLTKLPEGGSGGGGSGGGGGGGASGSGKMHRIKNKFLEFMVMMAVVERWRGR